MAALLRFYGKDIQDIAFEEWLDQKPEILSAITTKWFKVLKNCGPAVQDIFHDDHPVLCVETAPFAYIDVFKSHINLGFFYGAELPDPNGLLEGMGKRMRHIKLYPSKSSKDQEIKTLIEIAYADILERLTI